MADSNILLQTLDASLKATGAVFDIGTKTLGLAIDQLKDQLKEFDALQEQSLGIGLTYTEALNKNNLAIGKFGATLDTAFNINLSLVKNRLETNTEGLVKLAAIQEALGISSKETISTFKQVGIIGGLTNDQLGNLARITADSALMYNTSTEVLVKALDALKPAVEGAMLANGDVAGLAEASMMAVAAAGEANADRMIEVINFLADPSIEARAKKAQLGILDSTNGLLFESLSAEQKAKLVFDNINKAADTLTKNFGNNINTKDILKSLGLEQLGISFIALSENVGALNVSIDENLAAQKANAALNNVFEGIESAFNNLKRSVGERIEPITQTIIDVANAIAIGIGTALDPIFKYFDELTQKLKGENREKILQEISNTVTQVTASFLSFLIEFGQFAVTAGKILIDSLPSLMAIAMKLPEAINSAISLYNAAVPGGMELPELKTLNDEEKAKLQESMKGLTDLKTSLGNTSDNLTKIREYMDRTASATEQTAENTVKEPERKNILQDTNDLINSTFREFFRIQNEISQGKTLSQIESHLAYAGIQQERVLDAARENNNLMGIQTNAIQNQEIPAVAPAPGD
jgi:hypothetical protein